MSGMSRPRLLLVNVGILGLIVGSLFDTVTGREHWPFSPYAMYSSIELDTAVTRLHLYGVPAGAAGPAEVPLQEMGYIVPFDRTRLGSALRKLDRRPDSGSLLGEAAADVLTRYERLRRDRRHEGPALRAVRLYRERWRLDPLGRNLHRPDRRELLLEVEIP